MKRKYNKSNKRLSDWIPQPDLRRKLISGKTLKEYQAELKKYEKQGWRKRFKYDFIRENQVKQTGDYQMIMVRPDPKYHYINGKLVEIKIKM